MRSKVILYIISFLYIFIVFNENYWKSNTVLAWDKGGYYIYLPAVFIYNDLSTLSFYPKVNDQYRVTPGQSMYAIYDQPATGKRMDKYAIGVCLFELPFFLSAHLLTQITGDYPADGYSSYYQLFLILATLFWVIAGLAVLRRFLLRYYSDTTTCIVLLAIALGTNLYNYTAFDYAMSHSFSFFLFAAFLNVTDKWFRTTRPRYLVLSGLLLGWIIITRPTNILIALIPLIWAVDGRTILSDKMMLLRKKPLIWAAATGGCVLVLMIQMSYWKFTTGHWIHFAYEEEGFNLKNPEILNGLFSFRKGWFVYTPIAFLGMLGFIPLWKKHKRIAAAVLIYFAVSIYVIFSWHQWYYGGSFGCRALVESFAVFAIPIAALTEWIIHSKSKWLKSISTMILLFCISLNMFQTYQFSLGILPTDNITKAYYWKVFGKLHVTEEDRKALDE